MSSKIVNVFQQMYKQFNQNTNPLIFLNFEIEEGFYDVNVSPDKWEIFIRNEYMIVNDLNQALSKFFEEV